MAEPGGKGIPALKDHLCDASEGIMHLADFDVTASGRLAMIIAAAKEIQAALPGVIVKVPVSGPFSLASNILGLETLLCDCMTDPNDVDKALKKLSVNQLKFCKAISDAGVGITFFESAATPPLVPPHMFREIVLPALQGLIEGAAEFLGEAVPCIIGGDTLPILEPILSTGTRYVICPGETDQAAFMKAMESHPEVMVRINMNPAVFCSINLEIAYAEAERAMALAEGREKVCLGSGVLPYEAVPETTLAVKKYVEERHKS